MEGAASQQQQQQRRRQDVRYYGIDPFEQQWAASPYWPAAPVDFWAQSGTGQGFPDTTIGGSEDLEATATIGGGSGGEPTWMGNLARLLVFSVLLIALLVASLLLGRTSTWIVENELTPPGEQPPQEQHPLAAPLSPGRGSGGPWRPLNSSHSMATRTDAPQGGKTNSPYPYRTSRKITKRTTSTTEVTVDDITPVEEIPMATRKPNKRQICGAPVFTFCMAVKHEFYYNASQRACVSLPEQMPASVAVCNRGANKFASQESCIKSCVTDPGSEDPICHEEVLFTECNHEDVVGPLWYFNGDRCKEWSFPRGRCPVSHTSALFATSEECKRTCHKAGASTTLCAVPDEATCSPKRLKHPYFADTGSSGTGCTAATPSNLQRPLCLAGRNRFGTLQACKKLCMHKVDV
ncbi:uncharacterized protein LOC144100183 [Amblyomma americanum]